MLKTNLEKATQLPAAESGNGRKGHLPSGPFVMLTPRLNAYRSQMWISAQLVTHVEKGQESFSKEVAVWLRVQGVVDSGHKTLVGGQGHNRTRTIGCNQDGRCDSFIVMHLGRPFF